MLVEFRVAQIPCVNVIPLTAPKPKANGQDTAADRNRHNTC